MGGKLFSNTQRLSKWEYKKLELSVLYYEGV